MSKIEKNEGSKNIFVAPAVEIRTTRINKLDIKEDGYIIDYAKLLKMQLSAKKNVERIIRKERVIEERLMGIRLQKMRE